MILGDLTRALVTNRTRRASWIYLLWLAVYAVLAVIAIAYDAGLRQHYVLAFAVVSVPAALAYIQFRYPTVLGWALLAIPTYLSGGITLLLFLLSLLAGFHTDLAIVAAVASPVCILMYGLLRYSPLLDSTKAEPADTSDGDPAPRAGKVRRGIGALTVAPRAGAVLLVLMGAVYEFGYVFEFEYPFWPTLWIAEHTKTRDGRRVSELVDTRSGFPHGVQHWHHCTWCNVVYPHAPHVAVKVTTNDDENNFLLFDWDLMRRRLLPASVRTARLFPELIPPGYVVKPLGLGLNPQLYHNDEPCLTVAQSTNR
jgi:hypothetical protein